jgi:hypothetical protein
MLSRVQSVCRLKNKYKSCKLLVRLDQ